VYIAIIPRFVKCLILFDKEFFTVARFPEGLANPNVSQRITSPTPTPTETVDRGERQTIKY
jgi:hypothetical protein